jgi:leucyl-tRNA synthetase
VDKEGNQIAGYRNSWIKWILLIESKSVLQILIIKHTQWIFIQLFNSWYNKNSDKAEDISTLTALFEKEGNDNCYAVCDENIDPFQRRMERFRKRYSGKILLIPIDVFSGDGSKLVSRIRNGFANDKL